MLDNDTRLLCLLPGPSPLASPDARIEHEFWVLAKYFGGYVLSPVWERRSSGRVSKPEACFERFEYYTTYSARLPALVRPLWNFLFWVILGTSIYYRKEKYHVSSRTGHSPSPWREWLFAF